ncbi:MAG: protein kinase [bacterium]|nr:protein kinase [bacterium]
MSEQYKTLENFLIFNELSSDAIGTNYRVGEIGPGRKAGEHCLLTDVYPFLARDPEVWKRVDILMGGIKKSNIPNIYSPEKVIKTDEKALLVYPLIKGRTFEQVLDDSTEKHMPLSFSLVFSIAIAIADLIDIGSSIVVSGHKSFHGFLTPDNILIDYDGKISLKNYGIYPFLSKNEEMFATLVEKYGAWLTPEFLRKERAVPQSDIYHLGYIVFRILTGEYFSYSNGEDFDAKFSNLSFVDELPSSDNDFLTGLINFFKQTLDPDPSKRFADMKAFKEYIARYFEIEELSSVTFSLAYFMNSLYTEEMEEENKLLEQELNYTIPEPEKEEEVAEPVEAEGTALAQDILAGLDKHESGGSKMKIILPVVLVLVALAVAGFFYIQKTQEDVKKELDMQNENTRRRIAALIEEQKVTEKARFAQLEALKQKEKAFNEDQKRMEEQIAKLQNGVAKMDSSTTDKDKLAKMEKMKKEAEALKKKMAEEQEKEKERLKQVEIEQKKQKEKEKERLRLLEIEKQKQADKEKLAANTKAAMNELPPVKTEPETETPPTKTEPETAPAVDKGETTPVIPVTPAVQPPDVKPALAEGKQTVVEGQLFQLKDVDVKPKKIKGNMPKFHGPVTKQYSGRSFNAMFRIKIEISGKVTAVRVFSGKTMPDVIKRTIIKTLKTWKYEPAQKDNVKVVVWQSIPLTLKF